MHGLQRVRGHGERAGAQQAWAREERRAHDPDARRVDRHGVDLQKTTGDLSDKWAKCVWRPRPSDRGRAERGSVFRGVCERISVNHVVLDCR